MYTLNLRCGGCESSLKSAGWLCLTARTIPFIMGSIKSSGYFMSKSMPIGTASGRIPCPWQSLSRAFAISGGIFSGLKSGSLNVKGPSPLAPRLPLHRLNALTALL